MSSSALAGIISTVWHTQNAFVVFVCEMLIDIIKHSFLAKFNDIKPIAYSEFLEDLCKQTLNIQTEDCKKNLTFVPLAPACVVSACNSSVESGVCSSPSLQSSGMEILLDPCIDFHDLYHAHKLKSDDRTYQSIIINATRRWRFRNESGSRT
ncbi:hypothetical protein Goari_006883 [Gossypium aridum]|uniref:Uncharacterized protein n=1 Tax=Gossypium aridum TaxID=34290 RepID=A0A7J8XQK4_GOSAI|nr:hypothetical protein [Gossypium aridum]